MADDCYAKIEGGIFGPMSVAELTRLAKDGRITADTPIRRGGQGEWIAAGRIKGLQQELDSGFVASGVADGIPEMLSGGHGVRSGSPNHLRNRFFVALSVGALLGCISLSVVVVWLLWPNDTSKKDDSTASAQDARVPEEDYGYWHVETAMRDGRVEEWTETIRSTLFPKPTGEFERGMAIAGLQLHGVTASDDVDTEARNVIINHVAWKAISKKTGFRERMTLIFAEYMADENDIKTKLDMTETSYEVTLFSSATGQSLSWCSPKGAVKVFR